MPDLAVAIPPPTASEKPSWILDNRVQQYAEKLRSQWTAEQADLQRLYRKWSLKQPSLDKAITQLREEIRQHKEEIDELLMLRIQFTE